MRQHGWVTLATITLGLCCITRIAVAQNPPTQTAPAASVATATLAPVAPQDATSHVIQFPKQVEVKVTGLPEPSSGPGWTGSLVIGAILSALASIWTTIAAADKRSELETALQQSRESHATELAEVSRAHQNAMKEQEQTFQREVKRMEYQQQRSSQHASLSREDQKIETERRRLKQHTDASDLEIEIAVARLEREHEAEVAKLIHLYFENLTSDREVHRELALQALGEFVDVNSLRKLLVPKAESSNVVN